MIADLVFGPAHTVAGRAVREARFRPRSAVALSTACVVANGMRETLRGLFGATVTVEIGDAAAIDASAWSLLARDAELFVVSGNAADAAIVLDPSDARRLVLYAFGEDDGPSANAPSALERRAYDRIVAALAGALDPLCGERRGPPRSAHPAESAWTSYFDVRIRAPIDVRIGVAVARERQAPPPRGAARAISALDGVPLAVTASLRLAPLTLAQVGRLQVGDVVFGDTEAGLSASLNVEGQSLARGACGVTRGRSAVRISAISLDGDES